MEFHWNTVGILPPILSKVTTCFPELFRWNTTNFLVETNGILMEFLWCFLEFRWYFDGILVVFWWNSSQKAMWKVLLEEFNWYFCGIFHVFLILLYPKRAWKRPCTVGTWLVFWWKFHLTCIVNGNLCWKKPNKKHKRKTLYHYNIFMALTANRVNKNNKSNDRD